MSDISTILAALRGIRSDANRARSEKVPKRRDELRSAIGLPPQVEVGQAQLEPSIEMGPAEIEHGPQVEMGEAQIEPPPTVRVGPTQYDDDIRARIGRTQYGR